LWVECVEGGGRQKVFNNFYKYFKTRNNLLQELNKPNEDVEISGFAFQKTGSKLRGNRECPLYQFS